MYFFWIITWVTLYFMLYVLEWATKIKNDIGGIWLLILTFFFISWLKLDVSLFLILLFAGWSVFLRTPLLGVKVDCHDESVQTQHLSENQDEDHSNEESRLLCCSPYSSVTNDTDCKPGRQTTQTYCKSSTQVKESPGKSIKNSMLINHMTSPVIHSHYAPPHVLSLHCSSPCQQSTLKNHVITIPKRNRLSQT